MHKRRYLFAVSAGVLVLGLFAWAQGRKPGLWEVNTNMTWQQSPFPADSPAAAAMAGRARTTQVCVTQEQIDKFGAPPPQTQRDCQVANVALRPDGMSADLVCSGHFAGKGTIEAKFLDSGHSESRIHFTGSLQMGPQSKPIEWTIESSSSFKGSDCGSVKPIETK
ncbi:MAG TPA: DUF3617 family protein [Terracidiphilus sp.]|jgi:hypothetical protein|nr:DUF3617 family protein [Terracidiphilus sp.]